MAAAEPQKLSSLIADDIGEELKRTAEESEFIVGCMEVFERQEAKTGDDTEDEDFDVNDFLVGGGDDGFGGEHSEAEDDGGADENARGDSCKDSFKTAKHHLKTFLKNGKMPKNLKKVLNGASTYDDLPFSKLCESTNGYNFLNYFAKYFQTAKHLKNKNKELKLNSADRNLSAVKTQLLIDCKKKGHNPSNMEHTKAIRRGLVKYYVDRCARRNVKVSESHTTSTWNDIMGLLVLCLWSGTAFFAEFGFWVVSLVHLAGRGTETACVLLKNAARVTMPSEMDDESAKIFLVGLWRPKTLMRQDISIFPQKRHMLRDWYFNFAYYLVMADYTTSKYLFPTMAEKAGAELDEDDERPRAKSKVSQFFKEVVHKLTNLAQSFNADGVEADSDVLKCAKNINPNVSMHSQKRLAVNYASENSFISSIWTCFRAGWAVKTLNTIFDYLNPLPTNDRKVGRVTADWTTPDYHGNISGGYPPRVNIPSVDQGKMNIFCKALFMKWESKISDEVIELLTATIFRYLEDFIQIIEKHPNKQFGAGDDTFQKHLFLRRIMNAALQAGWTVDDLHKIHEHVYKDFVTQNVLYLSFGEIQQVFPNEAFAVDNRSLMKFMEALANAMTSQNTNIAQVVTQSNDHKNTIVNILQDISKEVAKTREDMTAMREEIAALKAQNATLQRQNATLQGGDDERSGNASPEIAVRNNVLNQRATIAVDSSCTTENPINDAVLPSERLQPPISTIFEHWYLQKYSLLYHSSKKSGQTLKPAQRNTYSDQKKVVEIMNCFLNAHIRLPPDGVNVNDTTMAGRNWRNYVREETKKAFKEIKDFCKSKYMFRNKETPIHESFSGTKFVKEITRLVKKGDKTLPNGPGDSYKFYSGLDRNECMRDGDELTNDIRNENTNNTASRKRKSAEI